MNTKSIKNLITYTVSVFALFSLFFSPLSAQAAAFVDIQSASSTTNAIVVTAVYDSGNLPSIDLQFEYGTNSALIGSAMTQTVTLNGSGVYTKTISGLKPQTRYYYRVLGTTNQIVSSSIGIIDTKSLPQPSNPLVSVSSTSKTSSTITINTFVDSNGASNSDIFLEYGTSTNLMMLSQGQTQTIGTSANTSLTIAGLSADTTYYVRVVAKNSAGTTYSSFVQIKTDTVVNNPPQTITYGCKDPNATNYNSNYTYHDPSKCTYSSTQNYVYGCTDRNALNYNANANRDNGSCRYSYGSQVYGCTIPQAFNYNPKATVNDGSCYFANYKTTSSNSDSGSSGVVKAKTATAGTVKSETAKNPLASLLGAAALFGSGFFPQTIIGWLILIFFVLFIIVLSRAFLTKKS